MAKGGLYVRVGEDEHAVASERARLEAELVEPGWGAFNLSVLPAAATLREVVEALRALPLGGSLRLVVVPDAELLATGAKDDPATPAFEALLDAWPPHAALLLTGSRADTRLRLVKKLQQAADWKAYGAPKPWELEKSLGPWLEAEARARGRALRPDGRGALVAAAGFDKLRLARELDKLDTYLDPGAPVDARAVAALVTRTEVEVFALSDALARRDASAALEALGKLLVAEPALKVAASLGTLLRQWLKLKRLEAEGLSPAAIAQATGASGDFKIRKDLQALGRWRPEGLARAGAALFELERALKTGLYPPELERAAFERALGLALAGYNEA